MSGTPDKAENYHTVTIDVSGMGHGDRVRVSLSQDNNKTTEARDEAQKNWKMMLESLKKAVESRDSQPGDSP